jgi:myo-inositol-1(or 4)-monophosphatase
MSFMLHKTIHFTSGAMLDFAIRLATNAGKFLNDHLHDDITIEHKGRIDLVTSMDCRIQTGIVKEIERAWPGHSILAEEDCAKQGETEYTWIIDPIDGTTNFIHHIPFFCVSIAVTKSGQPFIGVCYNPISGDLFHAQAGQGAYQNGRKIFVSSTEKLLDSLVATGFPYMQENLDAIIARFSCVLSRAQGIRRLGSAELDLCYVAAGAFDAFWEEGLKPWDMAAGVAILKEAGGMVTSLDGSPFDLYRGDILASNTKVHHELSRCM